MRLLFLNISKFVSTLMLEQIRYIYQRVCLSPVLFASGFFSCLLNCSTDVETCLVAITYLNLSEYPDK